MTNQFNFRFCFWAFGPDFGLSNLRFFFFLGPGPNEACTKNECEARTRFLWQRPAGYEKKPGPRPPLLGGDIEIKKYCIFIRIHLVVNYWWSQAGVSSSDVLGIDYCLGGWWPGCWGGCSVFLFTFRWDGRSPVLPMEFQVLSLVIRMDFWLFSRIYFGAAEL